MGHTLDGPPQLLYSDLIGWRKSADPCTEPSLLPASVGWGSSGVLLFNRARRFWPFRTHSISNGRPALPPASCYAGACRRDWTLCVPSWFLFVLCQKRHGASRPAVCSCATKQRSRWWAWSCTTFAASFLNRSQASQATCMTCMNYYYCTTSFLFHKVVTNALQGCSSCGGKKNVVLQVLSCMTSRHCARNSPSEKSQSTSGDVRVGCMPVPPVPLGLVLPLRALSVLVTGVFVSPRKLMRDSAALTM